MSVTATDNAGNTATTADTTGATVDTSAPSVTSVSVPADDTYRAGEDLDFTVNFDEAVTVNTGGGTPQIAITIGLTVRQAQFVSGGGTAALLFRYTVQAGDNDGDGVAVGALSANGGTLRDGVGNDATLTLNSVGSTANVLVDTTAPTGYTVSFDDTVYDSTETGAVSFTMAGAETGTTLDYTISSNNGGAPVTGSVMSVSSATEQVTGINVAGLNDGTLTVSVTLTDAGGNTGTAATDTATLDTATPAFSKVFAPDTVIVGGTSTLTFTIDNSAVSVVSSALDFTDTFPAGMVVATPANAATTCTGGTVTAAPGAGGVSYSGGSVAAGATCTLTVDVDTTSPGALVNTSGDLTSSQGNSGQASDTLTVSQPALSIADVAVNENAGPASFAVSLSMPSAQTITVNYATADGTALDGADYTATTGTLTFNPGDTLETIDVPILNDGLNEAAESFTVTLSSPSNATIADGSATGTINDDDAAPTISITDASVAEDAGTAVFTVSLSAASGQTVTVDFATMDGTALAGSDYTANSGTLTFTPGDTSETVSVSIIDDALDEPLEGFTVDLSSPSNATIADATGDGSITDNDDAPTISITDASVAEDAGTAVFTVSLSAASGQTVTVDFATTDGTALAGSDYTANSGTLTFTLGDTEETVTVTILDDSLNEPLEDFTVDLSSPANATLADATGEGAITDNDSAPALSIADTTVDENAGLATFTVSLSAASAQLVTVDYMTADGTAEAGSDYVAASGMLTFTPGDTSESFTVVIADDALDELDESFTAMLANAVNAGISLDTATGTITDDDPAPGLSIKDVTVDEAAGTAVFTVGLVVVSGRTVTVDYATQDGTAWAGSDYTAAAGTLTFAAGDSTETITVDITDDGVAEPDETFTVTLSNPSNATIDDGTATGTITDNDAAPGLFVGDAVAVEGGAGMIFTVELDAASGQTVTVDYTTGDGTAVAGSDYTTASGTATFTAGVTQQTITVDIIDDGVVEPDETFTFTLSNPGNAAIADGTATGTIVNDDAAPDGYMVSLDADPINSLGAVSTSFTFADALVGATYDFTISSDGGGAAVTGSGTIGSTDQQVSGIDVSDLGDGTLTLIATLTDSFGNTGADAVDTAVKETTLPGVAIMSASAGVVPGPFSITMTFTEDVTGFTLDDLVLGNATASNFGGADSTFTVDVAPAGDGAVTVDVPAGAAWDAAGNPNTAAEQFSIEADATAPELSITTTGGEVTGPFTASFTFSEPVTGFDLADIVVANGAASGLSGSDAVYTATITPQTIGAVVIEVADAAAWDSAGNASLAGEASVDAVSEMPTVDLLLSSAIADPGDVAGAARITNPGSDPLPFTALPDVDWIDVDPSSGTIPSLGALDLTIALNDNVNALAPGDYTATVTVTVGGAGATTASAGMSVQSAVTTLASIEISLTVEPRLGSIELVATTPAGASGEASFAYASDLTAFNGVTLTTMNGRASVVASEVLSGSYAITQTAPAGWRIESISCAGDLDGGSRFDPATGRAVIDLDPGEALLCTYENVRDEDAVRLATQRAIRNFMARRADRIVAAAPDFSQRFDARQTTQRGAFSADMDGSGRSQMAVSASLAGLRNAAAASTPEIAGVTDYERPFAEHWDVWLAAEVARVEDDRGGDDASSDFAVVQLGLDRQISDTLILGLMAQYDWMDEVSGDINTAAGAVAGARVEGEGWMAGPYAVWKLRDQLIFDVLGLYGTSENTVNPLGLYEDGFDTDRFMIRANLTGQFQSGNWRLRPQANLTHFEETQSAYTDSLNIAIPEQTLSLGRLTAGPEVAWRTGRSDGGYVELATSVRAVWDYRPAELLNEAGLLAGGDDDLRADARLGLSAGLASGMTLRLDAGFAGVGVGDFEATTGRLELRIPFGARGRGGASFGATAFGAGAQAQCDSLAGQGFAHAAGQTRSCDAGGFGPPLR